METRPRKLHTQVHSRMISGSLKRETLQRPTVAERGRKGDPSTQWSTVQLHKGVACCLQCGRSLDTCAGKKLCLHVCVSTACPQQANPETEGDPGCRGLGHGGKWGVSAHSYRASSGQDGGGTDGRSPPSTHRKPQSPLSEAVTCVCLLVRLEDPGGYEAASTQLALVGLLPGVGPHMLLQVAGLLEAFVAVLTPRNTARRADATSVHSTSTSVTSETEEEQPPP